MSLTDLAIKAYVYGFSLVYNIDEIIRHVENGVGANPAAPWNHFSHATVLAGPKDTFVSMNNDTVYSMAQLDLGKGPVLLEIPKTENRYFVFQCIDAWTNNFAYIGTRSIGGEGGKFVFIPPNYSQDKNEFSDYHVIHAPSTLISLVGRWACSNNEDLKEVRQLQESTKLHLLPSSVENIEIPKFDKVSSELMFWEKLRVNLLSFPDSPKLINIKQEFRKIGLLEVNSPYIEVDQSLRKILQEGETRGKKYLADYLINGKIDKQNGWQLAYEAFNFNTNYFEIGTLNEKQWFFSTETDEDIERLYLKRSAAALGGLWGNHGYEACYAANYVDIDGNPLSGDCHYKINFKEVPPVEAFWSITMYDMPNYYLVENEIQRYSIGSRTQGLTYNEDGSLTIYISKEPPVDKALKTNWLPSPTGRFRPMLRMYLPKDRITSKEYIIPGIQKM